MVSRKGKLEVFVYDCSDEGGNLSSTTEDHVPVKVSKVKQKEKKSVDSKGDAADQPELQQTGKLKRRSRRVSADSDLNKGGKKLPKDSTINPVEKASQKRNKLYSEEMDDEDGIEKPKKRRHSDSKKRSPETLTNNFPVGAKCQTRSKSEERGGNKKTRRRENLDQLTDSKSNQDDFHSSEHLEKVVSSVQPSQSPGKSPHRLTGRSKDCRSSNTKKISLGSPETNLRCIRVERGVVLILDQQQTISIHGRVLLSVLSGEVTVYGHKLDQGSPDAKIISPSSQSLISVTTAQVKNPGENDAFDGCKIQFLSDEEIELVISSINNVTTTTVLLLRKLDDNCCDFVSKIIPFHTLFGKIMTNKTTDSVVNEVLKTINVKVYPVNEDTRTPVLEFPEDFFSIGERWLEIIKQTTDNGANILTCGGKNSGKSTFNKFLINFTLQRMKRICYLDCDVGQTELNPPGSVALHILEEPLFGPPFSLQRDPYFMCFYGPVSPGDNPSLYSNCVKRVYQEYEKLQPKPPLIINTMGWNQGLGVNLLVDICHMTHPDYVVQLDSVNQVNNFWAITPEYISATPGWKYNRNGKNPQKFSHQLSRIDSSVMPRIEKQLQFSARDLRDLSTMGYFSRCLQGNDTVLSVPLYAVPWRYLALHTTHTAVPPSEILAAINASVVSLCIADISKARRINIDTESPLQFNQTPVCQCLGYGIVRAIDMDKHLIYILTPVEEKSLTRVNTLMRGSTNIPHQLILKQNCNGEIPYVDTHKSVTGSTSVRARRYMPRRVRDQ